MWSKLNENRLGHAHRHTYLSTKGGREAIVKSQNPIALHYMNGHPHHPHLHLLLCLQVYLERQSYISTDVIFNTKLGTIVT